MNQDAASRLWWAVRRYALLVIAVVAGVTGLAVTADRADPIETLYEANSLIIAEALSIRTEHLPRTASAIFLGGSVAEQAVRDGDLPYSPAELIPRYASLEPIENTVLLRVVGRHPDPETAASVANVVAEALIGQLNRPGPGVGQFAIQDAARVPAFPVGSTRLPSAWLIGLVAGLTLALGVVGLAMVLRRPVLSARELSDTFGIPVLGVLRLPRPRRDVAPHQVLGLAALVKRMYPGRAGAAMFVATKGDRGRRSQIAGLIAEALARSGFVCFVPSGDRQGAKARARLEEIDQVAVSPDLAAGALLADLPVVIDGPASHRLDAPQFLPPHTKAVLVVREGTPQRVVANATGQFLPGELEGAVFAANSPWLNGRRRGGAGVEEPTSPLLESSPTEATSSRAGGGWHSG